MMKLRALLISLVLVFGTVTASGEEGVDALFQIDNEHDELSFLKSNHRGGMSQAPENTLLAFENARQVGADSAEFDVRMDAGGNFFIHHDDDFSRRTAGAETAGIKDLQPHLIHRIELCSTYACSQNEDGDWEISQNYFWTVPPEIAEREEIPRLEETMEYFSQNEMVPRIDLKGNIRDNEHHQFDEPAVKLYNTVADHDMERNSIFISFPSDCDDGLLEGFKRVFTRDDRQCEYAGLDAISDEDEHTVTAALTDTTRSSRFSEDWETHYHAVAEQRIDMIVPSWDSFDNQEERKEWAEETRDRGFKIAFLGVDSDDKDKEFELNPVYTSTNNPEWLKDQIEDIEDVEISNNEIDIEERTDIEVDAPQELGEESATVTARFDTDGTEFVRLRDDRIKDARFRLQESNWFPRSPGVQLGRPDDKECLFSTHRTGCELEWNIQASDIPEDEIELEVEAYRMYDGKYHMDPPTGEVDFSFTSDPFTIGLEDPGADIEFKMSESVPFSIYRIGEEVELEFEAYDESVYSLTVEGAGLNVEREIQEAKETISVIPESEGEINVEVVRDGELIDDASAEVREMEASVDFRKDSYKLSEEFPVVLDYFGDDAGEEYTLEIFGAGINEEEELFLYEDNTPLNHYLSPSDTGTVEVLLTRESDTGVLTDTEKRIDNATVNVEDEELSLRPEIEINPENPTTGDEVEFKAIPEGHESYSWDIKGNDFEKEGRIVSETFSRPLIRNIRLQIETTEGKVSQTSKEIEIEDIDAEAQISLSDREVVQGEEIDISYSADSSVASNGYHVSVINPNGEAIREKTEESRNGEIGLSIGNDMETGTYTVRLQPEDGLISGILRRVMGNDITERFTVEEQSSDLTIWQEHCEDLGYNPQLASERIECISEEIGPECFEENPGSECERIGDSVCAYYYSTEFDSSDGTCK